jgi:hypothetical protein
MKCNETQGKWCKNKHGASKIIDMFETYHAPYLDSVGHSKCASIVTPLNFNFATHFVMRHGITIFLWRIGA